MKHKSSFFVGRLTTMALALGAIAPLPGDDAGIPSGTPLPLFAPPDSIHLPPPGSEPFPGAAPIATKDELYERLRHSLLDLEHRLQAREQSASVPAPPLDATAVPEVETQADTDDAPLDPMVEEPMPELDSEPLLDGSEDPLVADQGFETVVGDAPAPAETIVSTSIPSLDAAIASSPNVPALADNLYALGEYDLAYNTYQQLKLADLSTEDQVWVTYQLAGCLRHLGENASAASLYRQVLSQHPEHHLSGVSRWWLDAMEDDTEQAQAAETFRATLQRIQELRDDVVTSE